MTLEYLSTEDGLLFTNLQADHEAIEMARMVVDPSDYHAFLALAQLIKQNIIVDCGKE